jgi:hypothetical protein
VLVVVARTNSSVLDAVEDPVDNKKRMTVLTNNREVIVNFGEHPDFNLLNKNIISF